MPPLISTDSDSFRSCNPMLTILGSGVAIPQANRNAPGLLLLENTNQLNFLIDCGSGIPRQIIRSGFHYNQISHLFLSHLHADHGAGVPALFQALALESPPPPLKIYGPLGTTAFCEAIVQTVFSSLEGKITFEVTEVEEGHVAAGQNWEVKCTKVKHFQINAIAYRFEICGKVFVYSGDTAAPCENLKRLATEADLLVHECSHLDDPPLDQLKGHSTPSQVAELAQASKVKKLCLTHFYPEAAKRTKKILRQVRAKFNGEVLIAQDLLQIAF